DRRRRPRSVPVPDRQRVHGVVGPIGVGKAGAEGLPRRPVPAGHIPRRCPARPAEVSGHRQHRWLWPVAVGIPPLQRPHPRDLPPPPGPPPRSPGAPPPIRSIALRPPPPRPPRA